MKFESNYKSFHSWNCIWKCLLRNGGHIVQGKMNWVNKSSGRSTLELKFHLRVPHDDVIKWKHFPRYWPFVRGIHRSPVNSSHKGQWRGALMFSMICAWINGWVNNGEAVDLRFHSAHYDVIVMWSPNWDEETEYRSRYQESSPQ